VHRAASAARDKFKARFVRAFVLWRAAAAESCNNLRVRIWGKFSAFGAGLLLALLAVLSLLSWPSASLADGQDAAPPPNAAPAVIQLTAEQGPISLDGRSRYWVDNSGAFTQDQVEAAGDKLPWATRRAGMSYNLDGKALWLAFDVAKPADQRWYVEVQSSGIDRVQMFYRASADGSWVVQEAGDTKAVSQWPLPGRFPTFEIAPAAAKPVRVWLRIEHERVDFASPIVLSSQSALVASREREQFLLGGYFGLALLIALVAAANAVAYRDRNFGVYAVYVAALAAGQLAFLGVGAQHLWVNALKWNEAATFMLPGISAAAALWFAQTVTEPARFSRALDLVVWALIAGLLGAVAVDSFATSRASFALLMVLILVALLLVAGLIALVWTQGDDAHIRVIALGFLPVMVAAVFPVLRGLNLIAAGPLTRYALSAGAALEMPILFYALSLRGGLRREAQLRASALSGQDALTGLSHARTLLPRLEDALKRARSLKHPCGLLAVRLANYEAVGSEFGREVAERMLVVAASLLRNAITDIDLAVRIGERDFALLLEGPTTTENAASRAQQLVASGLRHHDALPGMTILKFNIAVALLPENGLDAAASIKWLLENLNSIPPNARKAIRPVNF
jgi:diguanylate cyclase (GGDEF)-like protein